MINKNDKCVGIVTIDDFLNYGNRLQNYALTRLMEEEGFRVINGIQVYTKECYIIDTRNPLKKFIKWIIPFHFIKKRIVHKRGKSDLLNKKREQRFKYYVNLYSIHIDPIIARNYKIAMKDLSQYEIDYFVTGSDQVWNPYYEGRAYEFLTFAPKQKRLSFAASIGVDDVPPEQKKKYKKYLNKMKYISVREQRATEIIKELTGRDADLTLDPTLLLESEKWQIAVKKPDFALGKKYICTYFLGEVPKAVKAFSKEKGLPIYALNSQDSPDLYTLDPAEFLYMIQNASYVLTDSFHAVAFSIKFNKEFYVFDRKQDGVSSMFSRIETITKRFGLENRIQSRDRIIEQEPISNWNEIENELVAEKKRSMGKLLEAMGL